MHTQSPVRQFHSARQMRPEKSYKMKDETNGAVSLSNVGPRGFPKDLGWVRVTSSDEDEAEEIDTQAVRKESAVPPSVGVSKMEANGGTIINDVSEFIRRFVFLPEDSQYLLVAVWIIATHLQQAVEFFGYLFAYSPEPQSGKTTLLDVLDVLVCNSSGVQNSPTEAVMFRTAQGNTHLLDEVDSWKDKDDLKSVLNAGYKRGGFVTRCDKGARGGFKPIRFAVFAPRALAGIGMSILPQSTLDRTFAISMVRQKKAEKRERFRLRVIRQEAAILKMKIEKWVKQHEDSFAELYGQGQFPDLDGFSDRTIDIAEPLAAIVELVYGRDPEVAKIRETLIRAIASTRKEQCAPLQEHRILKRLLELATADGTLVGNASELVRQFGNSEEPIDEHAISQALRKYGFKPRSIRKSGESPLKRYELTKAALEEVVERWVPVSDSEPVEPEEEGPKEAVPLGAL
jgi:hypothetical protein